MQTRVHILIGLAVASCFPAAAEAAALGDPRLLLLGAIGALLPGWLDEGIWRRGYRPDAEVMPDPLSPDPGLIANSVADAIDAASRRQRRFRLRLHGNRIDADGCLSYRLRLDPDARHVRANGMLHHRNTCHNADSPRSDPAEAAFSAPLRLGLHPAVVEIHAGTPLDIAMRPEPDGSVTLVRDPWKPHGGIRLGVGLLVSLAVGFMGGAEAALVPVAAFGLRVWTEPGDIPKRVHPPFGAVAASLALIMINLQWRRIPPDPLPAVVIRCLLAAVLLTALVPVWARRRRMHGRETGYSQGP